MKTILKIFKNDLIGIKKSILTIVLAVGLCILPALYAWFNIFANWDPYANTGNINIAVVNLDKGYTDADGNEMNMGQSVVDKLKSQTSIGWVFPESEKSAIGGVKSGTYYAAVVIDEDFSYNMFNALTDNFVNPSFTYYENEKKNAVAPKITDTAVSTLKTSINETYVKAIHALALDERDAMQPALREFEMAVLKAAGWAPAFSDDGRSPWYCVRDGALEGLAGVEGLPEGVRAWPGALVREMLSGEPMSPAALRASRDILRTLIDFHLDGRSIHSRRILAELNGLQKT